QVREVRADLVEQRHAFLARGGVGVEVHVLDHQVDIVRLQLFKSRLLRFGAQRVDVVQGKQQVERGGDGGVVVDDEDGGHEVNYGPRGQFPSPACGRRCPQGGRGRSSLRTLTPNPSPASQERGCKLNATRRHRRRH